MYLNETIFKNQLFFRTQLVNILKPIKEAIQLTYIKQISLLINII